VRAHYAAAHLGNPLLTAIGPDGFPQIMATSIVDIDADGFRLALPDAERIGPGPACLTLDRLHGDEEFLGQENAAFTGSVSPDGVRFDVDRLLPDFSLPPRGLAKHVAFFTARRRLSRRLESECARRGQPVPRVRLP
jgi:hypothetical protein